MAVNTLKLSELRGLSLEDRNLKVRKFMKSRFDPPNGEIDALNRRIAAFESRYEMSSDTMQDRLRKSEIHETLDICDWVMLLHVRDTLKKSAK